MLCSNCGEVVKPVVAIDVDGTLADFHQGFLTFMSAYLGDGLTKYGYRGEMEFKAWAKIRYQITDQQWYDIKLAYRQSGLKRSLLPYEGVQELFAALREMDVEPWLTTTRPYMLMDRVMDDTLAWLFRQGIAEHDYAGLLFDEDKYNVLHSRLGASRVAAVMDDLHENCAQVHVLFGPEAVIFRRTEYNAGVECPSFWAEAVSLREAIPVIEERIKIWKDKHDN